MTDANWKWIVYLIRFCLRIMDDTGLKYQPVLNRNRPDPQKFLVYNARF